MLNVGKNNCDVYIKVMQMPKNCCEPAVQPFVRIHKKSIFEKKKFSKGFVFSELKLHSGLGQRAKRRKKNLAILEKP